MNVWTLFVLFQKYVKYVKNLLSICAYGDYCCLTTKGDEAAGQVGTVPFITRYNCIFDYLPPTLDGRFLSSGCGLQQPVRTVFSTV